MIFEGMTKTYKHIRRYKEILNVLVKYGFGFIIEKIGLLQKLSQRKMFPKTLKDIEKLSHAQRLRLAFEELGPTFIKLGQILSTRPDILPKEYIDELVILQDSVREFDSNVAREEVEKSLDESIDSIFLKFENAPIASASISQVHKAVLKDGQVVAVKIRRPNIEKTIQVDIEILFAVARFIESRVDEIKSYNPVGVVEEFAEAIQKELDFTKEAWNIDKFSKSFEDIDYVIIPKIYWELTAKRMITMEYIDGIKVDKYQEKNTDEKKLICDNIAKSFMKQIFEDGYFHADPHPGNIFVVDKQKIAYLDFGMVGRLNKKLMSQIAELLIGVIEIDEDRIVEAFLDIGIVNDDVNIDRLRLDVFELIEDYHGKSLEKIDITQFLNGVFKIAREHKIIMPAEFTLLIKTFITVEGICRNLNPSFDIVEFAKPFVKKLIRERISLKSIIKESAYKLKDTNRHLMVLPSMLSDFFKKANSGKLKIDFQHKGIEEFIPQFNIMVNKLVLSIIIAALLVGSALVLQVQRGPLLYGFPMIGIIGFSFAGFLGLWLVFTIIRSGKM